MQGDEGWVAAGRRADMPPGAAAYVRPGAGTVWGGAAQIVRRFGLLQLSFYLCVLLPTLIGAFYTLALAPDEYVSEFRVVVRSPSSSDANISAMLGGGLSSAVSALGQLSGAAQNAEMVAAYVKSRNMVEALGGKSRVASVYSVDKGGWFAGLRDAGALEPVWLYWQTRVRTQVDAAAGILTVQVRAFTPEDAQSIASDLIARSEAMVNQISDRGRSDALVRADQEVRRAQAQVVAASSALLNFRDSEKMLDPADEAKATGTLITGLTQERMALENQRAAMGRDISGNSPTVQLLAARRDNINRQIASLKDALASPAAGKQVAAQLATYQTLQLRLQFSEQLDRIAEAAYQSARQAKDRQQLYVMTIVKPSLPEKALYPRRAADIFLVFGLSLIVWSIGALIIAAILDHTT